MINKLALHYAIGIEDLNKVEAALTDLAPQIHRRLLNQSDARVRVMTLVEGASDGTPHVVTMGYVLWPAASMCFAPANNRTRFAYSWDDLWRRVTKTSTLIGSIVTAGLSSRGSTRVAALTANFMPTLKLVFWLRARSALADMILKAVRKAISPMSRPTFAR